MSKEKATENSGFLDGRDYTAAFLYKLIALLVGNGVYLNELAPTATNEDMTITHGSGHAWINGVCYENTTPFVLDIATADGSLNRYDSLMVRLDLSANETYAVIVQGAYATAPTPPTVTRNAETWDLKICDIYIPAGCTKITQAQITDTRLDSSVCGVPVFPVEHLDMTTFYNQVAADLAAFKANEQANFQAWVEEQEDTNLAALARLVAVVQTASDESTADISRLLGQLNDLVDGDTVGQLLSMINGTSDRADELEAAMPTRARLYSCTLLAANWTAVEGGGYSQTVECTGVTVNTQAAQPFALPVLDDAAADEAQDEAMAMLAGGTTLDGYVTMKAREEAPPVDLTIYFLGVEINGDYS